MLKTQNSRENSRNYPLDKKKFRIRHIQCTAECTADENVEKNWNYNIVKDVEDGGSTSEK